MYAFAYEYPTHYEIIVTGGTEANSFSYDFGKEQDIEISVTESLLLAQLEIERKQPPTPIAI